MKWKVIIVGIAVALLLGINLFLILKEDSKVERSLFVQQWVSAKEQDLQETLVKDGVSAPLEEQHIYYDENKGSFEGFVVKEGDEVTTGTELFYYSIDSYTDAVNVLQSERDRVKRQLEGLEKQRTNLGSLLTSSSMGMFDDLITDDPSVEIDLYATEAEISKLESELEMYDERIASIDEKLPYLHEISDMDGVVKRINKDLSNPIMTLASKEPMIIGYVSEGEHVKLEPGLEVTITLKNRNKAYEGRVEAVAAFPDREPDVKEESRYAFKVVPTDSIEDLTHGSHVDIKIITQEIQDAITVPHQSLHQSQLYVLQDGQIEKRDVTTGLRVGTTQEIVTGLEVEEVLLRKPIRFEGETAVFYTPLHVNRWEKEMFNALRKKEMLKMVGKGFFSAQAGGMG